MATTVIIYEYILIYIPIYVLRRPVDVDLDKAQTVRKEDDGDLRRGRCKCMYRCVFRVNTYSSGSMRHTLTIIIYNMYR